MGPCICSWLGSRCVHAGAHCGWPHPGSDSPEPAFRRECFEYCSSSSHNQRRHSPVRLRRTWSRLAQTEVKSVGATFCESLPSCCCTGRRSFVRHRVHLCVQHPASHSLAVGITWNRPFLSCWFVCCCGRNINSAGRKE